MIYQRDSNFAAWIAAALLFIIIPPYFMWSILLNPFIKMGFMFIIAFLFYRQRTNREERFTKLRIFFIIGVLYFTALGVLNEQSNINGMISSLSKVCLVAVPFASEYFSKKVYRSFLTIYTICMTISLISYIGAHLGILSPIEQIQKVTGETNHIYNIYPLLVSDIGFDFLRFYGPFNEPGVVGTLAAVLLCVQKFDFKDWRTIVLMASGLLSMSFFFFVIVVGYGFVYLIKVKRNYLFLGLFIASFSLFYIKTKDDPMVYTTLWERFEWDESTQSFKGDNRQNYEVDMFVESIRSTPDYWFGCNGSKVDYFWNQVGETSSYKVVIVNSGAVFLILYLLFFVLLGLKCTENRLSFFLFVVVLMANTYQRPDIYNTLMIFMYSYFARFGLLRSEEETEYFYDS